MQRVNASFSFNGTSKDFSESNIRVSASGDPLGALGDLGECNELLYVEVDISDLIVLKLV